MEFGMTGSGYSCAQVAGRLLGAAHRCVAHDINSDAEDALVAEWPAGLPGGA